MKDEYKTVTITIPMLTGDFEMEVPIYENEVPEINKRKYLLIK